MKIVGFLNKHSLSIQGELSDESTLYSRGHQLSACGPDSAHLSIHPDPLLDSRIVRLINQLKKRTTKWDLNDYQLIPPFMTFKY